MDRHSLRASPSQPGCKPLEPWPGPRPALRRYKEIVTLLQENYGSRLRDLEPTPASEYHLYGDKAGHAHALDRLRKDLRKAWKAAQHGGR